MARRKRVYHKDEQLDPRYESRLVASLINKLMYEGKKSLAERIVYRAIEISNEGTESTLSRELATLGLPHTSMPARPR